VDIPVVIEARGGMPAMTHPVDAESTEAGSAADRQPAPNTAPTPHTASPPGR
jgi:hypothetical protein